MADDELAQYAAKDLAKYATGRSEADQIRAGLPSVPKPQVDMQSSNIATAVSAPKLGMESGLPSPAQDPRNAEAMGIGAAIGAPAEGAIAGGARALPAIGRTLAQGAVGSWAGQHLGGFFGPTGRTVGGIVGGLAGGVRGMRGGTKFAPEFVERDATKLNEPFAGDEVPLPAPTPEAPPTKGFQSRLGVDERPVIPASEWPLQTRMGMNRAAREAITPARPETPPIRTTPFGEGATSSATAAGGAPSPGAPASPFQGERVGIRGVTSPTPEEALGQVLDELRTGPELPSRTADPSLVTGDTAQQTLSRTSRTQAESMVPRSPRLGSATTTSTASGAPEIATLRAGLREGSAGDLATWKEDDLWAGFMKNRGTPFGNNLAAEIQRRGLATTPASAVRPSGGFFGSAKPPTATPPPSSPPSPTSPSGTGLPQGSPTPFQPFGTALRPEVQQMATPSGAAKVPEWVAGQKDFEMQRLRDVLRNPRATEEERQIAQQQLDFHTGNTQ